MAPENLQPESAAVSAPAGDATENREAEAKPEQPHNTETLDDRTFREIRDFVYGKCGITLGDKKKPLASARIRKRMRSLGMISPKEYFTYVMEDPTGMEVVMLLDSISTNVTSFFRESNHFTLLDELVRKWLKEGQSRFRFWSAACSSGEEPYTMAFIIKDALGDSITDTRILATDISTKVLGMAHEALYEEAKVKTVPEELKLKYLEPVKTGKGYSYRVSHKIKEMILFKRLNLKEMPFPMNGPMDVIFCRNVMIYFDKALREKLVREYYRLLKPGGYLIVGHTESLLDTESEFRRIGPSVYVK